MSASLWSPRVATEPAVGVLDGAALPWAVRVAEVGVEADGRSDGLMPRELAAVVVGDRAPGPGRQPAQLRGNGFGGELGIFAKKTTGERQPAAPLLQRQEDVALAAEVHGRLESWVEMSRTRTLDHLRLEFPGLIPMARRMRRRGS
jgi:hypothetical protein